MKAASLAQKQECSLRTRSPVLHLLPAPLLHLGLSLTLTRSTARTSLIRAAPHAHQSLPRTCESRESQPSRVQRHDSPSVPRLVSDQRGEHYTAPGPVRDVPHPLGQTLRLEVLAGTLEIAIVVGGTADALKPEFDEERGKCQDEPSREVAGRQQEVDQEEECVDTEGNQVGAIEDGRVAGCQRFERFLRAG